MNRRELLLGLGALGILSLVPYGSVIKPKLPLWVDPKNTMVGSTDISVVQYKEVISKSGKAWSPNGLWHRECYRKLSFVRAANGVTIIME